MIKKDYNKKQRIEYLLERMKTEPMNRHQMADAVGMSVKSVCKYITEMRFFKKIHIHKYERSVGQFTVFYMTGNMPDAPKPLAFSQEEYNKKFRLKEREPLRRTTKFTPRPDYAAHWLFNPI
jgi:hypothetical protein